MKRLLTSAAALAVAAGAAQAGGIERSGQSVAILFEKGNYAELSFGVLAPDVQGAQRFTLGPSLAGTGSGDMAGNYVTYSLAYKQALNDKLDFAIILDEAIGADVDYPGGTNYYIQNSTATVDNTSATALLRYKLPSNFSVIGGLRISRTSGEAFLPRVGNYTLSTSTETDLGYVVGVAWEKPEIAARVALTYNSEITHKFDAIEYGAASGTFETTIPESVSLEFQTGIAKNTLLFGSVRWVHWTDFVIAPPVYSGLQGNLVDYDTNSTSYTLGLGRKFNDQWSGAVILGYEGRTDYTRSNLGPTDGYRSIALSASYQATENIKITGAVRYVDIFEAQSTVGNFSDNSGWGAGIRVGFSF